MKRFFQLSLFLLLPVLSPATHVVGLELTYQCLGGNVYKLRVAAWVECSGVNPSTMSVRACASSCNISTVYNLAQVPGTCQPVFPVCSYPNSTCISGPDYGIKKCVYENTVTLPSCSDWIFYATYCCRSSLASNTVNPLSTGIGVVATLDNVNGPCNTSPAFFNEPLAFACCNQGNVFNQIAGEPDGDSLVYSLYNPLSDNANGCTTPPSTPVTYANPFTYQQFLTTQTPITINPANGDVFVHPTLCGEGSVVGVKVSEYRAGNLIGTIMRDIIVVITPQLTGEKEEASDLFAVHYNAYSGMINIESSLLPDVLRLYDVSGKELMVSHNVKQLNISGLGAGLYFVGIEESGKRYSYRIIKH